MGLERGKRYGNICVCITDSLCYKAETNTPKKIKIKINKIKWVLKVDARQTIGVGKWKSLEVIETMA